MKSLLIGSHAMKHWYGSDFTRIPKDIDYAVSETIVTCSKGIEHLPNPVLTTRYKDTQLRVILPNDLLTLKISHLFWDINFDKHMWDVQFLINKGCTLEKDLFYLLYRYWETVHGPRKTSDLNMSAEEFFSNGIENGHLHDSYHELLIKHPYFEGQKRPTYTKILKKGCEVDVCEKKFNNLTEKEKFNVTFEEVAIMSWEKGRFPENMHWRKKYHRMLKKFITSHCNIWQGIWIMLNYKKLLTEIPFDFNQFLNEQQHANPNH